MQLAVQKGSAVPRKEKRSLGRLAKSLVSDRQLTQCSGPRKPRDVLSYPPKLRCMMRWVRPVWRSRCIGFGKGGGMQSMRLMSGRSSSMADIEISSSSSTSIRSLTGSTLRRGDDWGGELGMSNDCFLLLAGLDENTSSTSPPRLRPSVVFLRLFPFCVMSLSCLPDLLCWPPRPDKVLLRGAKNLLNRLGVTVGGFFGFRELDRRDAATSLRDLRGEDGRMSWSSMVG